MKNPKGVETIHLQNCLDRESLPQSAAFGKRIVFGVFGIFFGVLMAGVVAPKERGESRRICWGFPCKADISAQFLPDAPQSCENCHFSPHPMQHPLPQVFVRGIHAPSKLKISLLRLEVRVVIFYQDHKLPNKSPRGTGSCLGQLSSQWHT